MKISAVGAMTGAVLGAIARSTVLFLNLGEGPLIFFLPSAAIGVLVGVIAGATGDPWRGAILGALLSAVVFELFMLPCVSLIGTFNKENANSFFLSSLLYALEMGVAGLIAGGIGGWVGRMNLNSVAANSRINSESTHEHSPKGESPTTTDEI